jgi:hypothetical protein
MFPQGTLDGQISEIGQISSQLATVVTQLKNGINASLALALGDVNNFIAFGDQSVFSGPPPDLTSLGNEILGGLNTYLVSQALQSTGIFVTRALNTDVHALTNAGGLNWQPLCKDGYDANGVCDTFWFDSASGTTYALALGDQGGSFDAATTSKGFNSIMQSDKLWKYTTPQNLFLGAAACSAQAGKVQGGGPLLTSSGNAACVSNMKVCTWDLTPEYKKADANGNQIIFTDCMNGDTPIAVSNKQPGLCPAPRSYLGFGIHNDADFKASNEPWCGPFVN